MTNVEKHKRLCEDLHELYAKKNEDYGDSFHKTFLAEGMTAARILLSAKLDRFYRLTTSTGVRKVRGETLRDTLIDLANYALMTIMELGDEDAESE